MIGSCCACCESASKTWSKGSRISAHDRTRTSDARQGILASHDHRILGAQRTRPIRLELYADNPAEERPAFLPMTKVWFVHDNSAAISGAWDNLSKAEGEFLSGEANATRLASAARDLSGRRSNLQNCCGPPAARIRHKRMIARTAVRHLLPSERAGSPMFDLVYGPAILSPAAAPDTSATSPLGALRVISGAMRSPVAMGHRGHPSNRTDQARFMSTDTRFWMEIRNRLFMLVPEASPRRPDTHNQQGWIQ